MKTWLDVYAAGTWSTSFKSPSRLCLSFEQYHLAKLRYPSDGHGAGTIRCADLGCGDLGNSVFLLNEGYHVTGVDIYASAMVPVISSAHPTFNFMLCDLRNWASDELFDAVLSDACLYYNNLEDFRKILVNIRSALKPKSCFRFSVKEINDMLVRQATCHDGIVETVADVGWEAGLPVLAFSAQAFSALCESMFPDFNLKFGFDFFSYADPDQHSGHRFLIATGERLG